VDRMFLGGRGRPPLRKRLRACGWRIGAELPGFLERWNYTHLGQCSNHGFFSFSELNHQTVLTPEASVVVATESPNFFNDGSARAGQADNLASLQIGQFTNTVHIGRFQKGTPKAAWDAAEYNDYRRP
jgi:hypothetical protein